MFCRDKFSAARVHSHLCDSITNCHGQRIKFRYVAHRYAEPRPLTTSCTNATTITAPGELAAHPAASTSRLIPSLPAPTEAGRIRRAYQREDLCACQPQKIALDYFRLFSTLNTMENGRRESQHPYCGIFSAFHLNCDAIGLGERVRNNLQFFTVEPNSPGDLVP